MTRRTFTEQDVINHLSKVCESNQFQLPIRLDSWHGFESNTSDILVRFGRFLEREYGWRYVDTWPVDGAFHMRVAKEGFYNETMILEEIAIMFRLAEQYEIELYVDCAPQPPLPPLR